MARMAFISKGKENAAATAWTKRPASKIGKLGANAQINEPVKKIPKVSNAMVRV